MGRLRSLVARLRRDARGEFEALPLVDGSTYYFDRMEASKQLYSYGYDLQLGLEPEAPLIWAKIHQARDPEAALALFRATNPSRAFVDFDAIYREQVEDATSER